MGEVNLGKIWGPNANEERNSLFREGLTVKKTSDYVNRNHDIVDVDFKQSKNYGEVAIVVMVNNDTYMTTSLTLKKQLHVIQNTLKTGVRSIGVRLVRMQSSKSNNKYLLYVDPQGTCDDDCRS